MARSWFYQFVRNQHIQRFSTQAQDSCLLTKVWAAIQASQEGVNRVGIEAVPTYSGETREPPPQLQPYDVWYQVKDLCT